MSDAAAYRFGVLVRQRRIELGLTQREVSRQGGPAGPTISNVERAAAESISPDTLAKLDRGLGWTAGSAARALSGGVPTTEGSVAETPHGPSPTGAVAVPVGVVTTMLRATRTLNSVLDGDIDVSTLGGARRELTTLESALSPICSRYLTYLIEDYLIRRDDELPADLAAVEHLLDAGIGGTDPAELDDRRYRRWLAGDSPAIDPVLDARYRARRDAHLFSAETIDTSAHRSPPATADHTARE
ncbi:helix-turn-helix transcriptional regulator [Rhodococcus sp. 1R11]|uniref:helix-turn-helix domain-containing protein n=1 Tax=Rhodococcus sp. 1R11 TaxID=2559614 RepID=UPI00142F702D|nr:helix-turn-helix transcriptional regulator [Rhodococcus sp. 1R11]